MHRSAASGQLPYLRMMSIKAAYRRKLPFRCGGFALFWLLVLESPAASSGWKLVFSDDFNGQALDRTKWATKYIYENEQLDHFNDEQQRYRDSGVSLLSSGQLSLTARKDGQFFQSGMIRSHDTFYYGYFEARVRLPSAKGVWPAFWLVGDYDLDGILWHPPEIDIFEYVINGVEDKPNMLHSAALDRYGKQGLASEFKYAAPNFSLRHNEMHAIENLSDQWHVAGLVWTPDSISFFWDGQRIYTREYQWLRNDGKLAPPAHVILNFAVGGAWAGRHGIDEASFPQEFLIDYVRVCQHTSLDDGERECGPGGVTPDPAVFGYNAVLDDMERPAFSRAEIIPSGLPTRGNQPTPRGKVSITLSLPKDYPTNRTLEVELIDSHSKRVVQSRSFMLGGETGSARHIDFDLPSVALGEYSLRGMIRDGGKLVPITCRTSRAQPTKSNICELLKLN